MNIGFVELLAFSIGKAIFGYVTIFICTCKKGYGSQNNIQQSLKCDIEFVKVPKRTLIESIHDWRVEWSRINLEKSLGSN